MAGEKTYATNVSPLVGCKHVRTTCFVCTPYVCACKVVTGHHINRPNCRMYRSCVSPHFTVLSFGQERVNRLHASTCTLQLVCAALPLVPSTIAVDACICAFLCPLFFGRDGEGLLNTIIPYNRLPT